MNQADSRVRVMQMHDACAQTFLLMLASRSCSYNACVRHV